MFIEICLLCVGLYSTEKVASKKKKVNIHSIDAAYQDAVQKNIDPFFCKKRTQQLKNLANTEAFPSEMSKEEKQTNRRVGAAFLNFSIAVTTKILYPPALVATSPITLWLSLHYFKSAYQAIFRKHKLNIAVLDSILEIWSLLAGYFFLSSLSIFLFTLSEKMLSITKDNSKKKLTSVFTQHPRHVWVSFKGTEVEIPFEELKTDDIIVVNAGEMIPADGKIIDGFASIEQAILTGEFQPAEKGTGEQVFASTIVLSGKIYIQVQKTGKERVLKSTPA
ncbi:MAG: hypothetical protein SD837_15555 [Candidatus Electrothrix scaldis]|nr:MAG: hypothetical protein SD837_15555 [Candidatus Electrothrix sp. GW3-3]